MSTSIEAQGHTVDEAIQIALNQLGVSRDKVEIDILHHPRRGVLGIGARRAKVRATIRESVMPDGEEFDMSDGSDLDDKPRRRRRRGGRNRSGGRDGDGPENAGETTPRPAAAAAAPREQVRSDGGRREGDAGRGRGGDGGRSRDDRRGGGGRGRGDQRGGERTAGSEGRQENQPPRGGQQQRGSQRGGQQGRGQDQQRGGEQRRGPDQQRGPESPRGVDQQRGAEGQRGPEGQRDGGREDSRDRSSQRGRQGSRDQGDRREAGRPEGDRRDAGRSEGDRRDAGRSGRADTAGAAAFDDLSSRPEGASPSQEHSRGGQLVSPRRPSAADEPPLDAETLELVRARAEELVKELLQKMGFAAEVTSSIDEIAGEAVVSVRSESEGLLIGRRGQTLDSLEHIVNRMTLRAEAYVEGRVLLDIGDYRKRRRESLDELASRLRTRAVGERRTVQVSPMSPRDRRFFAQAFADDESVEVRSLGAGFYRRVIVAPAGLASSAVAAAEAAGDIEDDSVETDSGFAGTEAES